ncbi:hypothetical protein [Streptomyces roseoverticillatus]|uniref:Uncharacterized protein n=1 Tax=Streptomyces roseoverticillatus TaxID=66429 RepID=A0ABV3IX63_9ACTN
MTGGQATAGDNEAPEQPPRPPVTIRLPDEQPVVGRLLGRWQSADGAWFYRVTLPLWAHVRLGTRDVTEPSDIEFDVAADHVAPVPGTSYAGVPIRRHPLVVARARTGRRHPATTPPPADA